MSFFSDAVFAIAMTLLVVGIGIPKVTEARLGHALGDLVPNIVAFFISFVVIGYYWLAHHRFFSQLRRINPPLMTINLVYLAAIAFMPFPTGLVSEFGDSPISVIMYAATLGTASCLEAVMFTVAYRMHALNVELPGDVFRYGLAASTMPVVVFALSIPISLINTSFALLSWLLIFPGERLLERKMKPEGADEFFR